MCFTNRFILRILGEICCFQEGIAEWKTSNSSKLLVNIIFDRPDMFQSRKANMVGDINSSSNSQILLCHLWTLDFAMFSFTWFSFKTGSGKGSWFGLFFLEIFEKDSHNLYSINISTHCIPLTMVEQHILLQSVLGSPCMQFWQKE